MRRHRHGRGAEIVLGVRPLEVVGARLHRVASVLDVHHDGVDGPVVEAAQMLRRVQEDRQRHDRRDEPVQHPAPRGAQHTDGPARARPGDAQAQHQLAEREPLGADQPDHQERVCERQRDAHSDEDQRQDPDLLGSGHQDPADELRDQHHGRDHRVDQCGEEPCHRWRRCAAVQRRLHLVARPRRTGRADRGARPARSARSGAGVVLLHRWLRDHHLIVLFLTPERRRARVPRFERLARDQLDALVLRARLLRQPEVP